MKTRRRPASGICSGERGAALVITLAAVVLVTIVVVMFLAQAMSEQITEASRANRIKAGLLARSAGDHVTDTFLQEITIAANSSVQTAGGVSIYRPVAASNAIPLRKLAGGVTASDTNFFNLIRQSAPGADVYASSDNTSAPARDGRCLTTARWNMPRLFSGDGFASTNQLPNWIYVTGTGGPSATASTNAIGRFAFNVYDVGGLLNANAAGHPASFTAADLNALLASAAGADLTQLGVTQTEVDAFIAFRNPQSAAFTNGFVTNSSLQNQKGYLEPRVSGFTNNYFSGRQDLLRFVRTQTPELTNALPYLTHFSRSVNSPSWKAPTAPVNTNPDLLSVRVPASVSSVKHFNDDATSETRTVSPGDPFVQTRFSLARLAWLTPTGPASPGKEEAIQSCFGLKWNATDERWDYTGPTGSDPVSEIASLAQAAADGREPNFFELLKAGILSGSTGIVATTKTLVRDLATLPDGTAGGDHAIQSNKDLQILRIGANVLDCADPDNFPTVIALQFASLPIEVAGIEDLPYMSHLTFWSMRQAVADSSQPSPGPGLMTPNRKMTACDIIWVPEFFNPHAASNPTSGPEEIRMDIVNGTLDHIGSEVGVSSSDAAKASGYPAKSNLNKDLSGPSITIPSDDFESFRNGPQPAREAGAPLSLGTVVPYATANADVQVVPIFSYQKEYNPPMPWEWYYYGPAGSTVGFHRLQVRNIVITLSYKTATGWKTYAAFCGDEALPGSSGMNGRYGGTMPANKAAILFGPTPAGALDITTFTSGYFAAKWDPRSSRLGPSLGEKRTMGSAISTTGSEQMFNYSLPLPPLSSGLKLGVWPQRNATDNWPDEDGIVRPNDAFLASDANAFLNMADASRRPRVLQRPFQSVAELGYVFRDVPWKTLSFFDATSPDAALLDLFSVTDEPVVTDGRVHLATRQAPVLQSLLSGVGQDADGGNPLSDPTGIAAAVQSFGFASGQPTTNLLQNFSQLAALMSSPEMSSAYPIAGQPIKFRREAVVRGLAGRGQARTWNLLVDVVAQTGRFPTGGAVVAGNFLVEGEQRLWISLALDRFTGDIIEQQVEVVSE